MSLSRNVTLPLLAAGGAATKMALDFDTALRQTVGLTDVTQDQIAGIRERLLEMGPAIGVGPQELAEAFYFVASAGFEADEAMEVLEISAKAAAAGLGETQGVAKVLGGVINAYGKENITAARAADILVEAVSQGTAEADQFAGVIGRVVPAAAAMGVQFDEVAAALAGMTLTGLSAEEAAVGLNQVFISLLKPTVQAEEAMEDLGLSSEELRRQLREEGLLATLRTLEERFAGNQTATAAVFGNVRALRSVTSLLTLDSEQLNGVFAKVNDSLGRLEEGYSETEGPQRALDRAMADLQATGIALGEDVLPMVVDVVKQIAAGARELGKWWRSLDDDTKKLIVQFLAYAAVVGPVLVITGKLVSAVGALRKGIGFLIGKRGLLLAATRFGLWGAAIGGAALALNAGADAAGDFFRELIHGKAGLRTIKELEALVGNAKWAQRFFDMGVSVEQLGVLLEHTGGDAAEAFDLIQEHGGDAAAAIESLTGPEAQSMTEDWARAWQSVANDVTTGADGMIESIGDVGKSAEEVPEDISVALVDGAFEVETAAEEGVVDPIEEALQKAREEAAQAGQDIIDFLANELAEGPEELKDELKALREALKDPYVGIDRIADLETNLANDAVVRALRSGDPRIEAAAFDQVQGWLREYEAVAGRAFDAGTLVNPSFRSGIQRNLDEALRWVQENVTGEFANLYDLADVLREMGYTALAAWADGVQDARFLSDVAARTTVASLQRELAASENLAFRSGFRAGEVFSDGVSDLRNRQGAGTAGRHLAYAAQDGANFSLYLTGWNVGRSYGDGLSGAYSYITAKAAQIRAGVQGFLEFAGSPAYTHSRQIGEGVGESWITGILNRVRESMPELSRTLTGAMASVVPEPPELRYQMQALQPAFAASGQAAGLSTTSVTNYNLNVSGSLSIDEAEDAVEEMRRLADFGARR